MGDDGAGWGLGSFGIKEHQESAKRLEEARTRLNEDRLLPESTDAQASTGIGKRRDVGANERAVESEEIRAGPSRPRQGGGAADTREGAESRDGEDQWEDVEGTSGTSGTSSSGEVQAARDAADKKRKNKGKRKAGSGDEAGGGGAEGIGDRGGGGGGGGGGGTARGGAGSSWSWWGPLKGLATLR